MRTILFVCTANICRSPMAEGILRKIVVEKKLDWRVDSAGVWAQDGIEPAENAVAILLAKGIDIRSHRSQTVNKDMLYQHDIVLVMEKTQKEAIELAFPDVQHKIFLISQLINEDFDIVDPIGHSLQDFLETAEELEKILTDGFEKIKILLRRE